MHQTSFRIAGIFLLLAFLPVAFPSSAEASPRTWGDLQPGTYAVGFKTLEKYDYSRAFAAKRDYLGNPIPGERARQIQVAVWYPATVDNSAAPMVYGEYTYAYPEDQDFARLLSQFQAQELQNIMRYVSGFGAMADAQNLELAAVREAAPASGPFPLLLYLPHAEGSYCENAVMCEFLASHGFIVATTHPLGTAQLVPHVEAGDLTTMVRDMAFVKGVMHDFPEADPDHLGLFGWGLGGVTALWTQMQDSDVDAVVDLGGGLSSVQIMDMIKNHPYFDPLRARVPLLELCPSNDSIYSSALLDSLVYSDRLIGLFSELDANNFSEYPTMAALVTGQSDSLAVSAKAYATISDYVLAFFQANLSGNKESLARLEDQLATNEANRASGQLTRVEGRAIPPTPEQFVTILRTSGVATAVALFDKFRSEDPDLILFPEQTLNILGYQLLQTGQTQDALTAFRMNRDTYPNSANTWDSYAEACVAAGQRDEAVECFRKSLELLETDTTINPQLREGIRQSATQNLEALEQPVEQISDDEE